MPIHSLSYRPWDGRRVSPWKRWVTICSTGIVRSSKSQWLRRLLFAAFIPLLFTGIPFFLFEQSVREPAMWQAFMGVVRAFPQDHLLHDALGPLPLHPTAEQFDEIRHSVWSFLTFSFLRYPQAFLMVIIVGIVAPPLISQDLRTRAYLIYFSRPITRMEYIVGKIGVVAFFLMMISALPALCLYVAAVLLSPSVDVVWTTWDLPLRILIGSAWMIVPTTLVALAVSSLTLESRYAGFAWFAIWIIGHVTYSTLVAVPAFEAARRHETFLPGWRLLTSPYQVIGTVQSYIFGFNGELQVVIPSFLLLIGVSLVSLAILLRRVAAPMRV